MDYVPLITVTPAMTRLCAEIEGLVASIAPRLPPIDSRLANELRTEQLLSLLSPEPQVRDLRLARAVVRGLPLESRGFAPAQRRLYQSTLEALDALENLDPSSLDDLMRLNAILARGRVRTSGWRRDDRPVCEAAGGRRKRISAASAPKILEQHMLWHAGTDMHPLIAAGVLRYEYRYVDPFTSASLLTGKLWHRILLAQWNPAFHWIPYDLFVDADAEALQHAVGESARLINDAPYVTYLLEVIRLSLVSLGSLSSRRLHASRRHDILLAFFADQPDATIQDAAAKLGVTPRTCARYVAALKAEGRLRRMGSRKRGWWWVIH